MVADGRGRAVAFALAPGQAHELPLAPGLLDRLPRVPLWVVGDRGYSSHELIWASGARPAYAPGRYGLPSRYDVGREALPYSLLRNGKIGY